MAMGLIRRHFSLKYLFFHPSYHKSCYDSTKCFEALQSWGLEGEADRS